MSISRIRVQTAIVTIAALLISGMPTQVADASDGKPGPNQKIVEDAGTLMVYRRWFNLNSGQCMGVPGGNMTNGTGIIQWPCLTVNDQFWDIDINGFWAVVHNFQNTSKCLGVPGGSEVPATQLVIWDCDGSLNQEWGAVRSIQHSDSSRDCYVLFNHNLSGRDLVAGVPSGRLDQGAPVIQWDYVFARDQYWCIWLS